MIDPAFLMMRASLPTLVGTRRCSWQTRQLTLNQEGVTEWDFLRQYFMPMAIGAVGLDFSRTRLSTLVGRRTLRWDLDGLLVPEPSDPAEAALWHGRQQQRDLWAQAEQHPHDAAMERCQAITRVALDALLTTDRSPECGGSFCLNFRGRATVTLISGPLRWRESPRVIHAPIIEQVMPP